MLWFGEPVCSPNDIGCAVTTPYSCRPQWIFERRVQPMSRSPPSMPASTKRHGASASHSCRQAAGEAAGMARTETVTVVFTDLVGSSELACRLGHDAYEALRHEHFAALRTHVAKHGGTEVKTTGDGLMLRFDSAADAIACAIAMQQATEESNPDRGIDEDHYTARRRRAGV